MTVALAMSEHERDFLLMYFKEEELTVVSSTRSPKPTAHVAENVTVITAAEIERMNAHTLGEVLRTIPGVQVHTTGGPGSSALIYIQGSEYRHATVFVDGVNMAIIGENVPDTGTIPVQHIERIEVIKGPASSAWGSSLGGIVNVITKTPKEGAAFGGTLSASFGERETGDYRAEVYGKKGAAGYYFYAERLHSDGFSPNSDIANKHFYSKLSYDLTGKTSVTFTLGYDRGERGGSKISSEPFPGVIVAQSYENEFSNLFSTLSLRHVINDVTDILLSFRTSRLVLERTTNQTSPVLTVQESAFKDAGYGVSGKLNWRPQGHSVVLGTDFDDRTLKSPMITEGEHDMEKWALYINDTITWDKLSLTPGIRYDHTNTNDDFVSPSLGLTYQLTSKTLLRAYVTRGFHLPPLGNTFFEAGFYGPNPDLEVEKVWSYQVGAETALSDYAWVKFSLFRHDIEDVIALSNSAFMYRNEGKQRRQGVEVEFRTAPVYNVSVFGGATFIDAKDLDTDEVLRNTPRYTYDFGVQYDDERSLKALVQGHYIWWNATPMISVKAKYASLIVNLNVIKSLYRRGSHTAELFVTAHNILNGAQYAVGLYKNPGRWIEGGIRYTF